MKLLHSTRSTRRSFHNSIKCMKDDVISKIIELLHEYPRNNSSSSSKKYYEDTLNYLESEAALNKLSSRELYYASGLYRKYCNELGIAGSLFESAYIESPNDIQALKYCMQMYSDSKDISHEVAISVPLRQIHINEKDENYRKNYKSFVSILVKALFKSKQYHEADEFLNTIYTNDEPLIYSALIMSLRLTLIKGTPLQGIEEYERFDYNDIYHEEDQINEIEYLVATCYLRMGHESSISSVLPIIQRLINRFPTTTNNNDIGDDDKFLNLLILICHMNLHCQYIDLELIKNNCDGFENIIYDVYEKITNTNIDIKSPIVVGLLQYISSDHFIDSWFDHAIKIKNNTERKNSSIWNMLNWTMNNTDNNTQEDKNEYINNMKIKTLDLIQSLDIKSSTKNNNDNDGNNIEDKIIFSTLDKIKPSSLSILPPLYKDNKYDHVHQKYLNIFSDWIKNINRSNNNDNNNEDKKENNDISISKVLFNLKNIKEEHICVFELMLADDLITNNKYHEARSLLLERSSRYPIDSIDPLVDIILLVTMNATQCDNSITDMISERLWEYNNQTISKLSSHK